MFSNPARGTHQYTLAAPMNYNGIGLHGDRCIEDPPAIKQILARLNRKEQWMSPTSLLPEDPGAALDG